MEAHALDLSSYGVLIKISFFVGVLAATAVIGAAIRSLNGLYERRKSKRQLNIGQKVRQGAIIGVIVAAIPAYFVLSAFVKHSDEKLAQMRSLWQTGELALPDFRGHTQKMFC